VLVVDDDADQRFIMRRLFTKAGIGEVDEAADGSEAIAMASAARPDVITLDLVMPGRSGLDVLPDLSDAARGAPIVVVSNRPRHRLVELVRNAGAVGFVEKRTPPERLVAEVLLAASLLEVTTATFRTDDTAPRSARLLVRDALGNGDVELLESAELLVSEVVNNAVTHAESAPRVDVEVATHVLRVLVHDDDPTPPELRDPVVAEAGGRGLLILDRLASRWGVEPEGDGKVVWFELDRAGT
jgi:CheY-like chemotaxis protein/anti-sigma regulatory factor (Ser/Thr protein kinase)